MSRRYFHTPAPLPRSRWDVPWSRHTDDIDMYYDHTGKRFLVRARLTNENAAHMLELVRIAGGVLALHPTPPNVFSWQPIENTWGQP